MMGKLSLWDKVMAPAIQKKAGKAINKLDTYDLDTIIATAEYWNATPTELRQIYFDLSFCKYRVFDWLAMCVNGRIQTPEVIKVFAHSFLKVGGDEKLFVQDLRETDYEIDTSWSKLKLEQS